MLIVIDSRIPEEAKEGLRPFGEIIIFETQNITYPAISNHPDIFICQTKDSLICAPNLPDRYFRIFQQNGIKYSVGENPVGAKFPETSFYNCIANESFLIHRKKHTDPKIVEYQKQVEFIDLPQAYTRCSLMSLPAQKFITSDKGIEKILNKHGLETHYFSPENIRLPEMPHGFIGGALGYHSKKLFVIGNPDYHSWGTEFRTLIEKLGIELISLYDGPFFDGGGIFFLE